MTKDQIRLILYQLHQANHALEVASTAEEDRAQGIVKAYLMRRAIGITRKDVDEFFGTEAGDRLRIQFSV